MKDHRLYEKRETIEGETVKIPLEPHPQEVRCTCGKSFDIFPEIAAISHWFKHVFLRLIGLTGIDIKKKAG